MTNKPRVNEAALRTMQALLRQPPEPHAKMKLGKRRKKKTVTKEARSQAANWRGC
jgi:hypothetical protein